MKLKMLLDEVLRRISRHFQWSATGGSCQLRRVSFHFERAVVQFLCCFDAFLWTKQQENQEDQEKQCSTDAFLEESVLRYGTLQKNAPLDRLILSKKVSYDCVKWHTHQMKNQKGNLKKRKSHILHLEKYMNFAFI